MKFKKVYEKVYKAPVYFVADCSQDEAKKKFRRYEGLEDIGAHSWGFAHTFAKRFDDGNIIYGVWVQDMKHPEALAHEVFHLANFILTDRGVKFDPLNDEPFAYLIEYFFKMLSK